MALIELFTTDRATTTVTSGGTDAPVSGTVETWTVASSAMFGMAVANVSQFHVADPVAPAEVIAVTAVSGTTWTVTRGSNGVTVTHQAGFTVDQAATAGFLGTASASAAVTAPLFSPLTFGAHGGGTTDDTAAVQAAFTAAGAVRGTVALGSLIFKTTSPIAMPYGVTISGATNQGGGAGAYASIINTASDLFTVTGSISSVNISNVFLSATAGHVFNCAPGSAVGSWTIQNTTLKQNGTGFSIFSMTSSASYIGNYVGRNCNLVMAAGATVPAWNMVSVAGAINDNVWEDSIVRSAHSLNVPFFYIQSTAGLNTDNIFRNLIAEQLDAGVMLLQSCVYTTVENVAAWDVTTYTGNLFDFGNGGVYNSGYILIRNSGRRGGTFSAGAYDVNAASGTFSIVIENGGGEFDTGVYNVPATQATYLGTGPAGQGNLLAPALSSAGITASTANPSRYVGATAGGAPASGTFAVGDWIADPSGTMQVCIVAGTPGTWARTTLLPVQQANNGAGGTNGTAVTAGNSGGVSGDAFSAVTGTVTFDSTLALPPSLLSYKLVTSGGPATVAFSTSRYSPGGTLFLRAYVYYSSSLFNSFLLTDSSGAHRVGNDGTHWFTRCAPGAQVTGTTTPAANTWYRVEGEFTFGTGTTATAVAKIYDMGGNLLESLTAIGGASSAITSVVYGPTNNATGTLWLANLAAANNGWCGASPVSLAAQQLGFYTAAPVAQPSATGTSTGFTANSGTAVQDVSTFTGGTGSTAYRISDVVLALKNLGLLAQ